MVASRFTLPGNVSATPSSFFVVLQFHRVQAGELDRDRRGARDPGRGVVVGDVDLLHVAAGDHVALRGAAVTGHHHAAGGVLQRDDRGAVRKRVAGLGSDLVGGKKFGRLAAQQFREGRQVHGGDRGRSG